MGATLAVMTVPDPERRSERYRELIEEFRAEFVQRRGHDHGFVTWVAEKLGRSQGFISQVLQGKAVGHKSVVMAAKRVGRSEQWFYADDGAVESHVELIDDHPQADLLAEFERIHGDRFEPYVYRMLRAGEYGRYGITEGQLLDAAKRYQATEEGLLKEQKARIGPPKRGVE